MERCQALYPTTLTEKFLLLLEFFFKEKWNWLLTTAFLAKPIGASSNPFVQKKSFLSEISNNATYSIGRCISFLRKTWGAVVSVAPVLHWGQKGSIHLHWVDILYWLCQKIHLFMLIHHCFCQYKCTGSPIKFWTTWKPHLGYFDHLETISGYLELFKIFLGHLWSFNAI